MAPIVLPTSPTGVTAEDIAQARLALDVLESKLNRDKHEYIMLQGDDIPAICAEYGVSYEPVAKTSWIDVEHNGRMVKEPTQRISYQIDISDYNKLRKLEVL